MRSIENWEYPPGATPLDPDEFSGLIPDHIINQVQLSDWEHANILEAENWLNQQKFEFLKIAEIKFIKDLHKKMFNKTWTWAGNFRQTNKSIGVNWINLETEIKILLDDLNYQIENHLYSLDELAARFHHRLVAIHPFSNGNSRHAQMMADIVLISQGQERFTWGKRDSLMDLSFVREHYLASLRAADRLNYRPLIDFVRT